MNVIITGASRGIGKGIAQVLVKAGHNVGLLARNKSELTSLKSELDAVGGQCEIESCDIRNHAQVQDAIDSLIDRLNGIYGLINNAALIIRKDIIELSADEWDSMIETNVNGVFYATKAVIPHLVNKKQGHIINISSISGRMPLEKGSGYAASKYAVTGFSESLFHEIRNFGIKVSTVFPGSVNTRFDTDHKDQDNSWKVDPDEIGEACLHILNTPDQTCISRVEIRPLRKS